jgi:hypothetical protein
LTIGLKVDTAFTPNGDSTSCIRMLSFVVSQINPTNIYVLLMSYLHIGMYHPNSIAFMFIFRISIGKFIDRVNECQNSKEHHFDLDLRVRVLSYNKKPTSILQCR